MLSALKNLFSGASSEASGASENKITNVKEKTRETAHNLMTILNTNVPESFTDASPDIDVMGSLYKMMVKIQADNMLQQELDEDQHNMRYLNEEMRHQEILDALSFSGKFKKPKKEKVVTEKETKPKEKKQVQKAKKQSAEKIKTGKVKPPKTESFIPTIPGMSGGSSIIPKIGLGVAVATGAAGAIAAAESGGDYDITFGDRRENGKLVNLKGYPTPEQLFHKKLTDMTLGEVKEFGKIRSSISPNSGAVGAYQFMPSTLFGNSRVPGLVQQLGLSMETKFDAKTQDALNNLLQKQNRDALTSRGVPTTPGNEYMAHYIGPAGAAAVYHNKNSNLTVAEVMASANLTPPGRQNNPELYEIKAKDFEQVLANRLAKKKQIAPHSTGITTGNTIDTGSKENAQLNNDLHQQAGSQTIINQTNMNMHQPQSQRRSNEVYDDSSAYERKSRYK